jgi:signal transduction histidine kinase
MDLRVVPSRAMVRSDEKWLERIVESFLSNAVEHSGSGKVLLGCRRRGDNLRIEVRDGGQGIAPDHFDRIFEEFYQIGTPDRDRHRGLGLGLAIAKRAADMLDHRIEAASRPGQGSMFAVEVPLAARSADAPSMSTPRYVDAAD